MNCDWCKKEINEDAIVCAYCQREKKSFYTAKMIMYTFLTLNGSFVGYGLVFGAWTSTFFNEFEPSRMFQTVSGWGVIVTFILSLIFYIKASKDIKSWWWY